MDSTTLNVWISKNQSIRYTKTQKFPKDICSQNIPKQLYLNMNPVSSSFRNSYVSPRYKPNLTLRENKIVKQFQNNLSTDKKIVNTKMRHTIDLPRQRKYKDSKLTQDTEKEIKLEKESNKFSKIIAEKYNQKSGKVNASLKEILMKKGSGQGYNYKKNIQLKQTTIHKEKLKKQKQFVNIIEWNPQKYSQIINPTIRIKPPSQQRSFNNKNIQSQSKSNSHQYIQPSKCTKNLNFLQKKSQNVLTPKIQNNKQILPKKRIYSPQPQPKQQSPTFILQKCHKKQKKMTIHDFKLLKELGKGKFGIVYLSIHIKTQCVYAIKKVQKQILKKHCLIDQFIMQVKLQSFLKHQNIIQLYDIFDDKQCVYLVEQYLPDGTLLNKLKKQKTIKEDEVSSIISQIGSALDYIHSNQIIHRDLKPENIVIYGDVNKICDFGWATICLDGQRRQTFCGTFDYTAPEMFQRKQYNNSIDMWCLGVLTYELLVGIPPFYHLSRKQTLERIKNVDTIKIKYPAHLSKKAIEFIQCLLKRNPTQRQSHGQILLHPFLKKQQQKQYH